MNEAYILERSDMITLDFLMSDYESYLRKDGREEDAETVQRFMKYIQKKEEKGNSL